MLCAALAGLGLARGAAAQTAAQANSPLSPTPYQSPLFHSGGSDPTLSLTPPFLNPLYGQLQGTPTETVGVPTVNPTAFYPVQIPSFDLGAYNPLFAPGRDNTGTSTPNAYYPDHLADGSVYSWQAPFNYVPLSVGLVTVDDSFPAPVAGSGTTPGTSGFALTGGWVLEPPAGGTSPAAGTATGAEYQRLPPGANGTATWTLVATTAGSYSVYFHIPDQIEDSTGTVEARSTQVTYQIVTTGTNAMTTTATASQTEANSTQFLAGPFLLAVGDTVTVTLQRDATHNQNTNTPIPPATVGSYVVADSMTLQTAIGDVRSAPTAINATAYPADFARVKYWGIFVPPNPNSTAPVQAGTVATQNSLPDTTGGSTPGGTNLYFYGDPAQTRNDAGVPDGRSITGPTSTLHKRLIRQLVYFGRQDPTFSNGYTVDDQNGSPQFTASGFGQLTDSTGTATNGRYSTASPVSAGAGPAATWALVAPNGGDYYVSVHLPQTPTNVTQKRVPGPTTTVVGGVTTTVGGVPYTININGVPLVNQPAGGFLLGQNQTGDVTLPTGPIALNRGDRVTVTLTARTNLANANTYTVVADSVRVATSGNGTGAIYCVDGFTGGIVWRFQTPGGLNGPSAPVFSSPVVTRINVLVTPATATTPAVYQNKLVVIVGDDNGMVYCLDAIGNGDGTSNSNAIDPTSGLPIYIPQPVYGAAPPTQVDQPGYLDANGLGHVGTTGAYWIYRPNPNLPKIVTGTGIGTVRRDARGAVLDPNRDLPVPAAFATASPNVFIDPTVSTTADPTTLSIPLNANGTAPSNAKVYLGNSNGVLYALDAVGVPTGGDSQTLFEESGDRFNASVDLRRSAGHFKFLADGTTPDPNYDPTEGFYPTPQPLWWFTLRGADPNSTANTSNADIESAPALYTAVTAVAGPPATATYAPTVYIGSSHEVEDTSNVGRLYALNGTVGPSGNNGLTDPSLQPDPAQPNYTGPGSPNYNIGQRPQIKTGDAADWSFPDAYDRTTTNATKNNQGQSSNKLPRPALGNITGSPVVFTNTNETTATRRTRIYVAANVGVEVPFGSAVGTAADARPDDTETGRIWAVNLDGSVGTTTNSTATVWSYPLANDPNNAALDKTPEPTDPLGSFLRATPAMGFVQFPASILNGDSTIYAHADAVRGDIKSQSVPMLYVATRGATDTALYAVDVDGRTDDERLIYRQISPDGSIFQSSPALITNTSAQGGNGGAVYTVSGNTLYDFSATPISNPGLIDPSTGQRQTFPLIRENKAYTGFGPISSPAVAAADVSDLTDLANLQVAHNNYTANATDWIYVGDSSTGFCRGITPYDTTDVGIPLALSGIVPPTADSPGSVDLQAIMQVYLVNEANSGSVNTTASALAVGPTAPLPVYDWGQNVYIRFRNVAPPSDPGDTATDFSKDKVVFDPNAPTNGGPIQGYGNGGPIEFDLSDAGINVPPPAGTPVAVATPADHGTVPAVFLPAVTTPLGNGFIARSDPEPASGPATNSALVDSVTKRGYIGAYTYAISDGTARRNTPGSRRQVINAKQTVSIYESTDGGVTFGRTTRTAVLAVQTTSGNEVSRQITDANGKTTYAPTLTAVQPVDEPTFGILNPLAVRGGGIPLPLDPNTTPTNAQEIGDTVGPFRGVVSPISNSATDLEALANGNRILIAAPSSTSGGGRNPTRRPLALTNPPTTRHIVVTSTGLIPHNNTGDNADAPPRGFTTLPLFPPQGTATVTANSESLRPTNANDLLTFGSRSAPFAMGMADRSALGPRQKRLRVKTGTISGGGAGLYWNDNSTPTIGHDHDAVVNFLPWESAPVGYKIGANPSIDYPDIASSDISATMYRYSGGTADLTLGNAVAEPAIIVGTDPVANRVVSVNPIRFQIGIPHFQPANQQLYRRNPGGGYVSGPPQNSASGGEIIPFGINSSSDAVFPMGYVTTRRIYIPDQGGFYRPGAAYRDVRVYTGVPPDYSTQMSDATVDVGRVPSGFGIQTSHYTPLTGLTAANPPTSPLATFDPYNPVFQDYFKELTIHNTGNVNLLNVHLDQKRNRNGQPFFLPLVSDALDITSSIPGYDNTGTTGPRSGLFGAGGTEPEDSYLIRSSLDGDLIAAYGHNPLVQNTNNKDAQGQRLIDVYPGATFHKAQVGSGQASTLFVPDSPEGFTQGASLDISQDQKPAIPIYDPTGSTSQVYKTLPYVSAAIPFGAPVGSYHSSLQLFEGLDSGGYSGVAVNANPSGALAGSFTGLTAQIFPPQYNGVIGGIGAQGQGPGPNGRPQDTSVSVLGGGGEVSLMPNSRTATVLNVKVTEDRMTDGGTFGAVPMIDQPSIIGYTPPPAAPDFAPAAFRDPASGNVSVYWTSGRSGSIYGIYSATVPTLGGAFMPVDPTAPGSPTSPNYSYRNINGVQYNQWWTSLGNASGGYNAGALSPAIPTNQGTNSGLTIAQDALNLSTVGAFAVNVQAPPLPGVSSYQNTLLYYSVDPKTGALGSPAQPITNDPTQVKYGVKGLFTNTAFSGKPNLWAFWTATTRGRTAIYYNSQDPTSNLWVPAPGSKTPSTLGLLPIPAGLTAVADAAPLLMYGVVPGSPGPQPQPQATIEVTYSGTAPDGNVDLYQSRYQPDSLKGSLLDLVPFPSVSEILKATGQPGGWYQTRDVAWSRTSQLNFSMQYVGSNGALVTQPLLYDTANGNKPLFGRAVFDKATGLLVLTGVANPVLGATPAVQAFGNTGAAVTVYIDYATGRVRFSATPNATVTAFFSSLARRITDDSRADTGPITFLDRTLKPAPVGYITADRRWYIWRKSGTGGPAPSATLYYKAQRLTAFLGYPIDFTQPYTITINGVGYTPSVDGYNVPAVLNSDGSVKSPASGRLFFPIQSGTQSGVEGQPYTVNYIDAVTGRNRTWPLAPATDTVQWQDEIRSNDTAVPPFNATQGLAAVLPGYAVPIDGPVNENNVSAFLDPDSYTNTPIDLRHPHKVWLFWNSTRNGTADLYYETINPAFGVGR